MTDCSPGDWDFLKAEMGKVRNEMKHQCEKSGRQHHGNQFEQLVDNRSGNNTEGSGGQRYRQRQEKQKGGHQQVQSMVQRSSHSQLQNQQQYGLQYSHQTRHHNEYHTQQDGQQQHGQSFAVQTYPVNNGQSQYQTLNSKSSFFILACSALWSSKR